MSWHVSCTQAPVISRSSRLFRSVPLATLIVPYSGSDSCHLHPVLESGAMYCTSDIDGVVPLTEAASLSVLRRKSFRKGSTSAID